MQERNGADGCVSRPASGLSAWRRVVDYRLGQLHRLPNVELFLESGLPPKMCSNRAASASSSPRVAVGRRIFIRRWRCRQDAWIAGRVHPSDLAEGASPEPPVLVFDFDNYYMGGAVAEHLAKMAGR
jgi:dimethylamine/trimethylamine dehydrogenase